MDDLSQGRAWCLLAERKNRMGRVAGRMERHRKHKNSGNEAKKSLKTKEVMFSSCAKRAKNEGIFGYQCANCTQKGALSEPRVCRPPASAGEIRLDAKLSRCAIPKAARKPYGPRLHVIPAEAGIHRANMDPRFRGGDDLDAVFSDHSFVFIDIPGSFVQKQLPACLRPRGRRVRGLWIQGGSSAAALHGYNPRSPISKALRTAWALWRHSWYSRAGTESATIPAPACR